MSLPVMTLVAPPPPLEAETLFHLRISHSQSGQVPNTVGRPDEGATHSWGLGQEWWGRGGQVAAPDLQAQGVAVTGVGSDARRTSIRQVGQVCCRWNQEAQAAGGQTRQWLAGPWDSASQSHPDGQALGLSHLVWKMWLQGSLLAPVTISSRQIMQTLSIACSSSGVASGYLVRTGQGHVKTRAGGGAPGVGLGEQLGRGHLEVFMLRIARRDMIASVTAFLNCLKGRFQ